MTGFSSFGFAELDGLAALFGRTRAVLDALLATGTLPDGGGEVIARQALPHIESVEAGFRAGLRAAEADLEELRGLVLQGGLGLPAARDAAEQRAALIEAMQARSGAGGERELVTVPAGGLAALEHARLALAMLPALPAGDVHFPDGRHSYADIAAPRTPGEFAARVEEIERSLWLVAVGRRLGSSGGAVRRVYGFFDAGEQLTTRGMRQPD